MKKLFIISFALLFINVANAQESYVVDSVRIQPSGPAFDFEPMEVAWFQKEDKACVLPLGSWLVTKSPIIEIIEDSATWQRVNVSKDNVFFEPVLIKYVPFDFVASFDDEHFITSIQSIVR